MRLKVSVTEAVVARSCTLPYRGFAIRSASTAPIPAPCSRAGRMQFGDTAECNSALRLSGAFNRTRSLRRQFSIWIGRQSSCWVMEKVSGNRYFSAREFRRFPPSLPHNHLRKREDVSLKKN